MGRLTGHIISRDMALDTSGVYRPGDDIKVINILGLGFGSYTLDCVDGCMNELEDISAIAAQALVDAIDAWEAADQAQTDADLEQPDGRKVLVKADVLEWEVINGGTSGPSIEKQKNRNEIARLLDFCVCLGPIDPNYWGTASLIRS